MIYNYYKSGASACLCVCECGNECIKSSAHLTREARNPPHCGCMTQHYKQLQSERGRQDLTGRRFGSLTVEKMIYKYKDKTKTSCLCDCGNRIEVPAVYLTVGDTTSCGCVQKKRASESNTIDFTGCVSQYGVELLRRDHQRGHGTWWWVCRCPVCGDEFVCLPAKVMSGHTTSCGCSLMSSGERLIESILESNHIRYYKQHRFEDCCDIKSLPFDFYLPDHSVCIEYNGKQHYYPIDYYGGYDAFMKRVRHDLIKSFYCDSKGIELLELPYVLSEKQIEEKVLSIVNA